MPTFLGYPSGHQSCMVTMPRAVLVVSTWYKAIIDCSMLPAELAIHTSMTGRLQEKGLRGRGEETEMKKGMGVRGRESKWD